MNATTSSDITAMARIRSPTTRSISGRMRYVPYSPTQPLRNPKISDVRISPMRGTRNSGKSPGREEGADVVERQDARDELFEVEMLAQDAHEDRQLQPDQHADHEND